MSKPLHLELAGCIYQVASCGNRQEDIYLMMQTR